MAFFVGRWEEMAQPLVPLLGSRGHIEECMSLPISTPACLPARLEVIPTPQSQDDRAAAPSQLHQAGSEEKTLRKFVGAYKSIIENLDRIEPDIDDLKRLHERMSTYRQLQPREAALTDKTEAVAATTRITISEELSDLPDIQDRAIKLWE